MSKKASSGAIFIVTDYSEKAFAVFGDTKEYTDEIKKLKGKAGRFMPLRYGKGWIFSSASADHKNVKQFLVKKGAVLLSASQYEKKVGKEEKEENPEAPKRKKAAKKKEAPVAGDDFYERNEKKQSKVEKFVMEKKSEIKKLYKDFVERDVGFHHFSLYVDSLVGEDANNTFDDYGIYAHTLISRLLPLPALKNLSMGVVLAKLLRPEFEGERETLSLARKWVKNYVASEHIVEKKTKKAAKKKVTKTAKTSKKKMDETEESSEEYPSRKTTKKSIKKVVIEDSDSGSSEEEDSEGSDESEEKPPVKAKKAVKKSTKKSTKKEVEKTAKKSTKKVAKKSTKKTAKKATKK